MQFKNLLRDVIPLVICVILYRNHRQLPYVEFAATVTTLLAVTGAVACKRVASAIC